VDIEQARDRAEKSFLLLFLEKEDLIFPSKETLMRKLTALAAAALLAGCAYPNPQHVAALNALVGKTETDMLRMYGVPNRTYDSNGVRFVTYQVNRIESIPGDFGPGFGYGGFGYGGFGGFGYGGFGPEIIQRDCDTTFELHGGVVQSYQLRGNAC